MKSLFTKLGVLLLGATFAVVGCTDFAEDIREVSDKVDNNMADVTVSTEALDDAIEDLKAQQAADKAAAETALAGLKTSLEGKIQTDIAAAEAKLEAAYKAADQVVTTGYTNADAALKAELVEKINEAKKAAEDANKTLEDALEAADKAIEDAYKAEDVKINASIAALESKLNTEVARVEGLVNAVDAKFKGFEEAYKNADIILDGKIADLSAELKKVDEAYKLADDAIKAAYEAADAAINKRIDDAEALIADLQKADTDLQAAIDANKKSAEDAIKAEADAREAAINGLTQLHNNDKQTLLDAIKVNSDAIAAEIKAREDADKNLKANIDAANDALAQAKKDLEDAIKANDKDIEDLQNRATALESWKTTAQQEIKTNKEDIAKLTGDLSVLDAAYKALDKALKDNIDKVNADLDAFKTQVDETYAKNTDLDAAKAELKKLVTDLEGKVNKQRTELEDKITNLDNKLSDLIAANDAAIKAEFTARENAVKAVEDALEQAKKDLEAADKTNKEELEGKISNLKKELEEKIAAEKKALGDAIAAEKKAREDAIKEVNKLIDAVEADVESLKKEDIALDGRLDVLEAWKTTAQDSIDDMSKRLAGVEVKLDKVWGRIQSLVYVPEFSDGKATINYAQVVDGSDNVKAKIESRSELVYKVYPDTLASIIAGAKDKLSFDVEGVTVRSVPGVDLNIVSATGNDENGTITLVVEPRGFADDFYGPAVSGKQSYSVALIVNNGNDYFSSEYTNLIASANEKIYADLYNSSNMVISSKKTDAAEVVEIAYNNDSTAVNILEGHYLGFHTASAPTEILTLDKMVEAGYDLEVASPAVVYDYYNMDEDGNITSASDQATAGKYFNATEENGLVTVKLSSNNETTSVGFGINPVYTYNVYGMSLSAGSIVQIVKEKRQFNLGSKTATWDYMLDAAADAYIFNPSLTAATYDRTFTIPASEIKLDNVLNESYADVISSTQKSLTVNGVASTAVTFGVDGNNATVKFVDFEWGKKYDIVAKYDTGSAIVDVVFSFNTVDRTRDDIIVKTDTTKSTTEKPLIYKKDMKILKDTYKYAFGETLFNNLGTNIAGIEKDAYLEDIFVNHAISNVLNKFYDAAPETDEFIKDDSGSDSWTTRVIIDPATREFTFGYAYNSFDKVYTSIKYVKEFTSWYGQKFILEHVIVIDLPKYNFNHASYYVKANANNDGWYSKVMGQYTPSINAKNVSGFSVAAVDMDMAFNVVNETGSIIPADKLGSYGLKTEFSLEKVVSGITITDNEISYMSPEDEIGVTGKLFIVNGNGSKVELPTRFNDVYANYVVKKYDPIGKLVASEETVEIIDVKKYEINVLEYFTLKDNRNETEVYDLIVDGAWLNGDGSNGYSGLVTTIYGLNVDYADVIIPAEYVGVITFNSGVLTFDNSGNLTLMEDVVIPITLKINYTWGSRTATFKCTFPKNIKEPVTE